MFNRMVKRHAAVVTALLLSACVTAPPVVEGPAAVPGAVGGESASPPASNSSPDNYVLGQGDEISILVFDEPDLTLDALVGASGFINYSYLGNIQVANKTPLQLEEHIAGLLENGYLVNPAVNVSVKTFRPFFIGGEVRNPGSYPFQPGLTLEKAIALAGGLSERASTRRMYIVKAGASAGQQKIELSDAVGPGDTITIQEGFF